MKSFAGKLAVVTGGGAGMGKELVRALAAEGCSVAALDISPTVEEVVATVAAQSRGGVRVSAHRCDITDEVALERVRDAIVAAHEADHVDLLFNNAGIYGKGSFLRDDRADWERVFDVCWYGVYNTCRVFMPLVLAADEAHVTNTASTIAIRAVHGPFTPSTSYSASKFAVRGFTEALIEDFRTNAPHVKASIVFPGAVMSEIRENSDRVLGSEPSASGRMSVAHERSYLDGMGVPVDDLDDETIARLLQVQTSDVFAWRTEQAAAVILDGIRQERWRIFVGSGAVELDEAVRAEPERAYDHDGPSLINRDKLISVMVLNSRFAPADVSAADAVVELRLESMPLYAKVADGRLELTRDNGVEPDVTVEGDWPAFRNVAMKEESLAGAVEAGSLRVTGETQKLEQLLAALAV